MSTAGSNSGFTVPSSYLLSTNLSSSSVTGNIGDEEGLNSAASIAPLTDGQFGPPGLNGPNPEVVIIHDGVRITYNLDTVTNPLGYDITSIDTYADWRDSGRSQQDYTVLYSTVNAPNTFLVLANVSAPAYNRSPSDTAAFLTSRTGSWLAMWPRFNSPSHRHQNGYVGYRELAALGSPSSVTSTTKGGGLYNGSGHASLVNSHSA